MYFSYSASFNDTWRDKDETGVLSQAAYEDMIYSDKYQEVELEFRRAVDDVMRQEIELLQTAVGNICQNFWSTAERVITFRLITATRSIARVNRRLIDCWPVVSSYISRKKI